MGWRTQTGRDQHQVCVGLAHMRGGELLHTSLSLPMAFLWGWEGWDDLHLNRPGKFPNLHAEICWAVEVQDAQNKGTERGDSP